MRKYTDQKIVKNLSVLLTGLTILSFQGCSPAKSNGGLSQALDSSTSGITSIGLVDASSSKLGNQIASQPSVPFSGIQGTGSVPVGPHILSVSNSSTGSFSVNGTVCTKSSTFIRIANVERYRALACIMPAGQGCGLAEGHGMYEPNYKEFLNNSTIQMDRLSQNLTPGLYDVYYSTLPLMLEHSGAEKVGTFRVVENCNEAANLNTGLVISQEVAAAPVFPSVYNGPNSVLVSNEAPDVNGYFWHSQINLCNKGQFYLEVNLNNKTYPLKICTTQVGSNACQDVTNFHEFAENEWPGFEQVRVQADASRIAVGDYEVYLAFDQKTIAKAASFHMQSCQ